MLPSCVVSVRVEREAQKAKSRGKGNPDCMLMSLRSDVAYCPVSDVDADGGHT